MREKKSRKKTKRILTVLIITGLLVSFISVGLYFLSSVPVAELMGDPEAFDRGKLTADISRAVAERKDGFTVLYRDEEGLEEEFSELLGSLTKSRLEFSGIKRMSWKKVPFMGRALYDVRLEYGEADTANLGNALEYSEEAVLEQIFHMVLRRETKKELVFRNPGGKDEEEVISLVSSALKSRVEYRYLIAGCTHSCRVYDDYIVVVLDTEYYPDRADLEDIFEAKTQEEAYRYFLDRLKTGLETVVVKAQAADIKKEDMNTVFVSAYYNDAEDIAVLINDINSKTYEDEQGDYIISYSLNIKDTETFLRLCGETREKLDGITLPDTGSRDLYARIFDYVTANCEYDYFLRDELLKEKFDSEEAMTSRGSYGALVKGKSICSGYAAAFKALCDRYGLPCMVITGKIEDTAHVWNAVLLDGIVSYVDCTFADTGDNPYQFYMMGNMTLRRAGYVPDKDQYIPEEFRKAGLSF